MPSALLALFLFAATVGPRLEKPLRLLAEACDASGQPIRAVRLNLERLAC